MQTPAMTDLSKLPAPRTFLALQLASWLLFSAVAVFSAPMAQAAETSAADASALKVLSTPLNKKAKASTPPSAVACLA
jgi:hypothetical protein